MPRMGGEKLIQTFYRKALTEVTSWKPEVQMRGYY